MSALVWCWASSFYELVTAQSMCKGLYVALGEMMPFTCVFEIGSRKLYLFLCCKLTRNYAFLTLMKPHFSLAPNIAFDLNGNFKTLGVWFPKKCQFTTCREVPD